MYLCHGQAQCRRFCGGTPTFFRKRLSKSPLPAAKYIPIIPKKMKEYNYVFGYVKNLQETTENKTDIVYNHKSCSKFSGKTIGGNGKSLQKRGTTLKVVAANKATGCS
jgi:hypothetical protein